MLLDDCSEFLGHKLKNCSRCGHQFDGLRLTRLNCDELNAIKDKESQFGFRWKLSDWPVGEVIKVDVCPECYSDVVNLIDANEQVDKLTAGYVSEHPVFLTKQLNIPFYRCQICHKELPKKDFLDIPFYITGDILRNPDDYLLRRSRSEKEAFLDYLSRSKYVKVCRDCCNGLHHEYRRNQLQRHEKTICSDTPVYIDGKSYRNDGLEDATFAIDLKYKNGIHIKLEERKMKNVNEKKNTAAFAIERNYDETDRKLFRLEDTETGDFIRLATDEERLIYMVVNTDPVKSRVKVNEKSGSNSVWCVCIQTQDLVELPRSEMVYVYDPRYIAFRIGRFIDE